jgi:transposase
MFIRLKKIDTKTRVQIVNNERSGDRVCQKIIRHVGIARNETELEDFKKLATKILNDLRVSEGSKPIRPRGRKLSYGISQQQLPLDDQDNAVNISNLREELRLNDGFMDVFGKLFDELGFGNIIKGTKKDSLWNELLKRSTIARIIDPQSKLATTQMWKDLQNEDLNIDRVYQMMDVLSTFESAFKKQVAKQTLAVFDNQVDVLLFDVTTLYFESFRPDELRSFGFSKDCKFKETQVVLALVTTTEGMPIAYELFPGSTSEGQTIIPVIKAMKQQYEVKNLLLVADRAMFVEDNLKSLELEGVKFIVAAKLKGLTRERKKQILNSSISKPCVIGKDFQWVTTFKQMFPNRKLIVSYSSGRAAKDSKERARLEARLRKKATPDGKITVKNLITNAGTNAFIKTSDAKAEIDEQKLTDASAWDGLHGVITNELELSEEAILDRYHELWRIEESFRINKNNLSMRPIYHWKPKRIKSHILICYLAFALLKHAMYRLKNDGKTKEISIEQLRRLLTLAQSSHILDIGTSRRYQIPSCLTQEQKAIYDVFKLKRPIIPRRIEPKTIADSIFNKQL